MGLRTTDPRVAVWRVLLAYQRHATNRLDADLQKDWDLSLEEYDVLLQLSEAAQPLRMSELADRVLTTRSSCTRLVERLVDRQLVIRRSSLSDGRVVEVTLADGGRAILRRAAVTHLRGIENVFAARLDGRDLADLSRILDHLEEAVRKPLASRGPKHAVVLQFPLRE